MDSKDSKGRRLNWRQACALLGCGKKQFYRLVQAGKLPAYRMQGRMRGLWVYEADCRALEQRVDVDGT